jgi:hypothetical protein
MSLIIGREKKDILRTWRHIGIGHTNSSKWHQRLIDRFSLDLALQTSLLCPLAPCFLSLSLVYLYIV